MLSSFFVFDDGSLVVIVNRGGDVDKMKTSGFIARQKGNVNTVECLVLRRG